MTRYKRSFVEDEEIEQELDENGEALPNEDDATLTPEEKTWKKRHGDLRSFSSKQLNERDKEIERLKQQLAQTTQEELKFPKTEAEIDAWMKKFPDVAGIVKSIAMKEAMEANRKIDERLKAVDEREQKSAKKLAQEKLQALHPDFFDEIRDSEEFETWLDSKSKRVQDALYDNDTDWQAAAEVIDMYKLEKRIKPHRPTADERREAAREVPNRRSSTPPSGRGEYRFSESQIEKMSQAEYERNEPEITKAIVEGKMDYDLSGGAR